MAVTEREIARIPVGNLRVPRAQFAAVWIAADARDLGSAARGIQDWYAGGVRCTCMWLAGATFRPPWGRPRPAAAPVTHSKATAYEELIETEFLAAELMAQRQPWLLEQRPGWCEAIQATLRWAWRHDSPPPLDPVWPGAAPAAPSD